MLDSRKWIGMTLGSFSNKTGYDERSLKSNGGQRNSERNMPINLTLNRN